MSQTIGPYRVVGELGRGGQGVVYRVEHHETGEAAALKTVRTPSPERMQGLRREIHALARLEHPGVVRILDEGQQAGLPWYAMELVEGRTLLEHCRGLWQPETGSALSAGALRGVLSLVRKLCAPLAYLHGEGVVHRDLKPQNVLVRGDGTPVLVDFGLVARLGAEPGREALELAGEEGTAAYMAPEQLRGEPLDARADLYGLGCLLYEALTGQPTYERISDVLDPGRFPRRPSERIFGIPQELDELLLRLLSKDPSGRIGHADVVAAALGRLGAEDGLAPGPRPRAYLYRPGFAGRQRLLEALLQHAETRLWTGAGGLILVGGESGIGKTRFATELGRGASVRGIRVLSGECLPGETALRKPLQAVADRCRELGPAGTERLLGRRGKVLAAYEPALRELPGAEAYPEPAELPPKEARLRLFGYLAETLSVLCQERPLLLVLDDLQWADELALGFLEFLLGSGRLERDALLVLGTYRTEEVEARSDGPASPLRRLLEKDGVKGLQLERLDEAAVAEEVSDMLGLRPPPAIFARYLARHSEGNPFFVAEYLRSAVETGLLWRDQEGRWQVAVGAQDAAPEATEALYEALALPRSLRELVGRRLEGLSEAARRCVEAAAVLGRQMAPQLLAEAAGGTGAESMEAVTELLRRQVLEQLETGELRFLHDKLREVAYERVRADRRRALHRVAAGAMEEPAVSEPLSAVIGHHWEQAGEPSRARPRYLEAARQAKRRHAHEEAERLYRSVLRLSEAPSDEGVRARNEMGYEVLHMQGRKSEALDQCHLGLSESQALGDFHGEARSSLHLGTIHRSCGRMAEALALYERALAAVRRTSDRRLEGIILSNVALAHQDQTQWAEAQRIHEQSLALSRTAGDRSTEANTLNNLALLHHVAGRLEDAQAAYREVLLLVQGLEDKKLEGIVLGNLGIVALDLGRPREALALYERAAALARQIGDRQSEGRNAGNIGFVLLNEGRLTEAAEHYEKALAIARGMDDLRSEGVWLGSRARLERLGGRSSDAERSAHRARGLLHAVGDGYYNAITACELGHQMLDQGRPAQPWLAEAGSLLEQLAARPESELGQAVTRLRAAAEAFEREQSHRLFRGELLEDLPEGLRRRLAETGQLPQGP